MYYVMAFKNDVQVKVAHVKDIEALRIELKALGAPNWPITSNAPLCEHLSCGVYSAAVKVIHKEEWFR